MRARLLLDEMFSPQIASELVRRGHDVVALDKLAAAGQLPGPDDVGWLA